MITSASAADTISNNLLLEQTGHLTFVAIGFTSSSSCQLPCVQHGKKI